jgi:hypothetical protein
MAEVTGRVGEDAAEEDCDDVPDWEEPEVDVIIGVERLRARGGGGAGLFLEL